MCIEKYVWVILHSSEKELDTTNKSNVAKNSMAITREEIGDKGRA